MKLKGTNVELNSQGDFLLGLSQTLPEVLFNMVCELYLSRRELTREDGSLGIVAMSIRQAIELGKLTGVGYNEIIGTSNTFLYFTPDSNGRQLCRTKSMKMFASPEKLLLGHNPRYDSGVYCLGRTSFQLLGGEEYLVSSREQMSLIGEKQVGTVARTVDKLYATAQTQLRVSCPTNGLVISTAAINPMAVNVTPAVLADLVDYPDVVCAFANPDRLSITSLGPLQSDRCPASSVSFVYPPLVRQAVNYASLV